jgi:hypothetical protein
MTRRSVRQLGLVVLFVLPASAAIAQSSRFDLQKTKTVLTGLVEKTLAENGIPSMSIALVRGDSIVWKLELRGLRPRILICLACSLAGALGCDPPVAHG